MEEDKQLMNIFTKAETLNIADNRVERLQPNEEDDTPMSNMKSMASFPLGQNSQDY